MRSEHYSLEIPATCSKRSLYLPCVCEKYVQGEGPGVRASLLDSKLHDLSAWQGV